MGDVIGPTLRLSIRPRRCGRRRRCCSEEKEKHHIMKYNARIYRKTKGQQCSLFIINCSFGRCKTYARLCILTRSYVFPATFPRLGNVADDQLVSYLCHKAFVDSGVIIFAPFLPASSSRSTGG